MDKNDYEAERDNTLEYCPICNCYDDKETMEYKGDIGYVCKGCISKYKNNFRRVKL